MPIYNYNLDEENPAGDPATPPRKKDPFIYFAEPLGISEVDRKKARRQEYMKQTGSSTGDIQQDVRDVNTQLKNPDLSEDEITSLYSRQSELYDVWGSVNKAGDAATEMSQADLQRGTDSKFIQENYDYHPVQLTKDPKQNKQIVDSVMGLFNENQDVTVALSGHSSENRVGGLTRDDWKKSLGDKADDCLLGMCDSEQYAPHWAEGLGANVTAQGDKDKWSGTNPNPTSLENFMVYDPKDKEKKRSKVFSPIVAPANQ